MFSALTTVAGAQYDFDFPSFVIVSAPTEATQMRVTTTAEAKAGALAPIPGTTLKAGVVVVEKPSTTALCSDNPELWSSGPTRLRVDALNDAGTAVACLGMVPYQEQ